MEECDSGKPGPDPAAVSSTTRRRPRHPGGRPEDFPQRATRSGRTVTSLLADQEHVPVGRCAAGVRGARAHSGPVAARRKPASAPATRGRAPCPSQARCSRGALAAVPPPSAGRPRGVASLRYAGTTTRRSAGAPGFTRRSRSPRSGAPTRQIGVRPSPRRPSKGRGRQSVQSARALGSRGREARVPGNRRDPGSGAMVAGSARADVSPQDLAEAGGPDAAQARRGRATPVHEQIGHRLVAPRAAAVPRQSRRMPRARPVASPPMSSNDSRPSWISAASSGAACDGALPRRARPEVEADEALAVAGRREGARRGAVPPERLEPSGQGVDERLGQRPAREARHDSGRAERNSHSGLACVEP